jgi:hypothetical protein
VFSQEHPAPAKAKSATLMTGCGNWHYPVSAKNAQAQAFFDQGLRFDVLESLCFQFSCVYRRRTAFRQIISTENNRRIIQFSLKWSF